jgi:hypothetical protein
VRDGASVELARGAKNPSNLDKNHLGEPYASCIDGLTEENGFGALSFVP